MWTRLLVLLGIRTDLAKIVSQFDTAINRLNNHVAQATDDAKKRAATAARFQRMADVANAESAQALQIARNLQALLAK